jgi:hypothetical protein
MLGPPRSGSNMCVLCCACVYQAHDLLNMSSGESRLPRILFLLTGGPHWSVRRPVRRGGVPPQDRVRDSRSDAGASTLYLSRLHSCQLDRCDQPSSDSQGSRRFIRCGGCGQWRKEAVCRQILACVPAMLALDDRIVFNRLDLPRHAARTRQGDLPARRADRVPMSVGCFVV